MKQEREAGFGDVVEIDGASGIPLLVVDDDPDNELMMVSWIQRGRVRESMICRSSVTVIQRPTWAD